MTSNLAGGGVTITGVGQTLAAVFNAGAGLTVATSDLQAASGAFTPVTLALNANNTVIPAANGAPILGGVKIVEERVQEGVTLATVQLNGGMRFRFTTGDTVAVGDSIIGGGGGTVRKATGRNNTTVIARDNVNQLVTVLFGYINGYGVV